MTTQEKKDIRKLQATLQAIKNKEKVFFNITLFQKKGLVYSTNKWGINAQGKKIKIGTNWFLTEKAESFLNVVV